MSIISKRITNLNNHPSAIVEGHILCSQNPYSKTNPEGYLNFGIAENHLMEDYIIKFMDQKFELNVKDCQYFNFSCLEELKDILIQFFKNNFNLTNLDKENFVIMNGLSATCEALSYSLFDEHDYIMIPTPYYTGFEHDFQKRFQVNFLKVHLKEENNFQHTIEDFQEAFDRFQDKKRIKAILLTHPHNPTGEVLNEKFLKDIIQFAKENHLEIISDEIYALTKFQPDTHQSIFSLAHDYNQHIHLLYGLAKDFTLAGMKVGIFYSDNKNLVMAMKGLTYFYPVSSLTQKMVCKLFSNQEYVEEFLKTNTERLHNSIELIKKEIPKLKFIKTNSGLFIFADLKDYLEDNSFESEEKIFKILLEKYQIFVTPGKEQGLKIPGYFRICFAKNLDSLHEFIGRMNDFLNNEKVIPFSEIGSSYLVNPPKPLMEYGKPVLGQDDLQNFNQYVNKKAKFYFELKNGPTVFGFIVGIIVFILMAAYISNF